MPQQISHLTDYAKESLENVLETSIEHGLTESEAMRRLDEFGINRVQSHSGESPCVVFCCDHCLTLYIGVDMLAFVFTASASIYNYIRLEDYLDNLQMAIIILFYMLSTALLTFAIDRRQQQLSLTAIELDKSRQYLVLRNSGGADAQAPNFTTIRPLDSSHLVPGDIIKLNPGNKVPADVIVLSSDLLYVDDSNITGECEPVLKGDHAISYSLLASSNFLSYSSYVHQGHCTGLVVNTGNKCLLVDAILSSVAAKKRRRRSCVPFCLTFDSKSGNAGDRGINSNAPSANQATVVAQNERRSAVAPRGDEMHAEQFNLEHQFKLYIRTRMITAIFFIATIVGLAIKRRTGAMLTASYVIAILLIFMPQLLVIAYSLVLLNVGTKIRKFGFKIMSVRKVPNLGDCSVVCFDKTGTLTKNELAVHQITMGENMTIFQNKSIQQGAKIPDEDLEYLIRSLILCNDSYLSQLLEGEAMSNCLESSKMADLNFVETCLAKWCIDQNEVLCRSTINTHIKCISKGFDSKIKMSYVVVKDNRPSSDNNPADPPSYRLLVKGAPEVLIGFAAQSDRKKFFQQKLEESLDKDMRCIALGERTVSESELEALLNHQEAFHTHSAQIAIGIRIIALISLCEDLRDDAAHIVGELRNLNMKLMMITGDHPKTATHTAYNCGILSPKGLAELQRVENMHEIGTGGQSVLLTTDDLETLNGPQLRKVLASHKEVIVARCTPANKQHLIRELQLINPLDHTSAATNLYQSGTKRHRNSKNSTFVAFIGDGMNDTPAFNQADASIALASAENELGTRTATMILNGEKLLPVLNAFEQGRLMIDNFIKGFSSPPRMFVLYLVMLMIIFTVNGPILLKGSLFFLLDILTDMPPIVAFVNEPPEKREALHENHQAQATSNTSSIHTFGTYTVNMCLIGIIESLIPLTIMAIHLKQLNIEIWQLEDLGTYLQSGKYLLMDHQYNIIRRPDELSQSMSMANYLFVVSILLIQTANMISMKTRRQSLTKHRICANMQLNLLMMLQLVIAIVVMCIYYWRFSRLGLINILPDVAVLLVVLINAALVLIFDEIRKLLIRACDEDRHWLALMVTKI